VGLARLEARFAALDAFRLAGLSAATGVLGSVVLGLALARGRLDADEAFRLSRIDESWQAEHWGWDAQEEARAERLRRDIADTARFLTLLEQA
jgi:chaperone required for assembly of F1-ATPase